MSFFTRKWTRREVGLAFTLGATCSCLGYMHLSPLFPVLRQHSIQAFKSPGYPVRIAHLADFHADETPLSVIETSIQMARAARPDLICLTGDFVSSAFAEQERYLQLLSQLVTAAPTFAVMGNHDGGAWATAALRGYPSSERVRGFLKRAGMTVLHNESLSVTIRDRTLDLIGVADLWSDELKPQQAFAKLRSSTDERYTILLSHNPDSKDELQPYPWNLMLSGHTHGGQLVIPITGERPFAPVRDKRYIEGLRAWEDRLIHVTCGVGSLHGMRFNCPPEVSIIDLV